MPYPTAIDAFTTKVDGVTDVLAADTNNLQAAIVSIETKLGITGSTVPGTVDFLLTTQTWQNMLASRAWNTTYTNSTGRPIKVLASGTSGANLTGYGDCYVVINGVNVYRKVTSHVTDIQSDTPGMFEVPSGATFRVNMTGTYASPTIWYELR